jgi:hypothetical protein
MKPLNEILSSICETLNLEYKESMGSKMGITEEANVVHVSDIWCCQIWKDGKIIIDNYAAPAPTDNKGITENTKQAAREWLLYSLISKASNLQQP